QLSTHARRRLSGFRARSLGWLVYPMQVVVAVLRALGQLMADWWSRRNLRLLLQGLPALLLSLGAVTFGVVVFFQDRNLLATMYKNQAWVSLSQTGQAAEGKDNTEPLARADTCFQRLWGFNPDEPEYLY